MYYYTGFEGMREKVFWAALPEVNQDRTSAKKLFSLEPVLDYQPWLTNSALTARTKGQQ